MKGDKKNLNKVIKISVVIISKNSGSTIKKTLDSLINFDEVILYDNDSEDNTLEIAKQYENVKILEAALVGFGLAKNFAVENARNDWIFTVNADEYIDETLEQAIRVWTMICKEDKHINRIGRVSRINLLMGRKVTRGGWQNDTVNRIFNRGFTKFDQKIVNEGIMVENAIIFDLAGNIYHQAVIHLGQFLLKINTYSEIYNQFDYKYKSFFLIVLVSLYAFCKSYFFKLGILEGWRGFIVAYCISVAIFFRHAKFYAIKNKDKLQEDELSFPIKYQNRQKEANVFSSNEIS